MCVINSYRIIKTDLENSSLRGEPKENKLEFWEEYVKMIPRHSGETFQDTLFVWTGNESNEEIKFKVLDKNKFIEPKRGSFGFWSSENAFKDTIVIGVFEKEEVNQGNFIYIKETSFQK